MKEIDELIEKYQNEIVDRLPVENIIKDLESLKQSIKKRHKKDVMNAFGNGYRNGFSNGKSDLGRNNDTVKYYNDNHETN